MGRVQCQAEILKHMLSLCMCRLSKSISASFGQLKAILGASEESWNRTGLSWSHPGSYILGEICGVDWSYPGQSWRPALGAILDLLDMFGTIFGRILSLEQIWGAACMVHLPAILGPSWSYARAILKAPGLSQSIFGTILKRILRPEKKDTHVRIFRAALRTL